MGRYIYPQRCAGGQLRLFAPLPAPPRVPGRVWRAMREEDLQQMGGNGGSDGAYGDMEAPSGGRLQGAVADGAKGFLASRNIGWLMELEEEAEGEELRPIMEELDIDPADIKRKILCVLLPTAARREQLAAELSSDSDFWGPLFCVLAYVLVVVWGESSALSWSLWLWVGGAFGVFVVHCVNFSEIDLPHAAGVDLIIRATQLGHARNPRGINVDFSLDHGLPRLPD